MNAGTIHCNLGPSFGFITPEGNSGTQYRDNVYFDLRSYIAEAGRHVHDLTQELRINETVSILCLTAYVIGATA